jgi:hypothetical protein
MLRYELLDAGSLGFYEGAEGCRRNRSERIAVNGQSSSAGDLIVFVLGMGRSGSSAAARVISLCGGRLPDSLLPPNEWNRTGYWEPSSAVHLNAQFLRACGSSFFDTQIVQDFSEGTELGKTFVADLSDLLRGYRSTTSNAPLVLKDPRISVLVPFWLAAAARANFSPRVVICVRHPREVASSLSEWKGLPTTHTGQLWLKYNLLAEHHTRHLPRAFLSYERLLANWRQEVHAISVALGLALTPNAEVDQFLDPELRHTISEDPLALSEAPWLRDVYGTLSSACRGDDLDSNLLDAALLGLSHAQATGALPVVRSFGTEFGIPPST